MILTRFLPGVLKELVKHVPTVLFQTVEWSELASELPKLSRRVLKKEGFEEFFQSQNDFLKSSNISLTQESFSNPIAWPASKILELFFAQLFSPHGVFLDLKPQHFELKDSFYRWAPTSFWTQLAPEFRKHLIDVYDGFFLDRDDLYESGLVGIGLMSPEWSQEDKEKLGDLFKGLFSASKTGEMTFKLDEFREAMMQTTNFLLKKKVKISKDFLYLGIYLVNLYSTLDATGESAKIKEIYEGVRSRFS